ncbi:MAG: hypothetical protein R3B09_32370 [Nannocystaceae bacterium]
MLDPDGDAASVELDADQAERLAGMLTQGAQRAAQRRAFCEELELPDGTGGVCVAVERGEIAVELAIFRGDGADLAVLWRRLEARGMEGLEVSSIKLFPVHARRLAAALMERPPAGEN